MQRYEKPNLNQQFMSKPILFITVVLYLYPIHMQCNYDYLFVVGFCIK